MPGIGEHGVRGTAPCWTEADRADLSGGPPGAERGTRSGGKDTQMRLQEPPAKAQEAQTGLVFSLTDWRGPRRSCTPGSHWHPKWSAHRHWSEGDASLADLCVDKEIWSHFSYSLETIFICLLCHTLSWPGGHLRSDWSGL